MTSSEESEPPYPKRRRRRLLLSLIALVLVGFAIWTVSPAPVAIQDVVHHPTHPTNLEGAVDVCQGNLTVEIDEGPEIVEVTVKDHRIRLRLVSPACADGVTIPLEEPLGDRILIDGSSGEEIVVQGR